MFCRKSFHYHIMKTFIFILFLMITGLIMRVCVYVHACMHACMYTHTCTICIHIHAQYLMIVIQHVVHKVDTLYLNIPKQ